MTNQGEKDLSEGSSDSPVDRLWAAVLAEWEAHGRPRFSEIEKWSVDSRQRYRLSRGTLSDWFANHRMPREGWAKFEVLLLYFNVDTRRWRDELWRPAERVARDPGHRRRAPAPPVAATDTAASTRADSSRRTRMIASVATVVGLVAVVGGDQPAASGPSEPSARRCAIVLAVSTAVFDRPGDVTPRKHKYRAENVALVTDLEPLTYGGVTFRAVRTPRDPQPIGWIRADDLTVPRRCAGVPNG